MKNWIKTGALASLLALVSFVAHANNPESGPMRLLAKVMPDNALQVQLVNLQQKTATIELTDLEGKVLHRDLIRNHNGYARIYDLGEVDNGRYLLKAEQDDEEVIVVIRIKDGTIMTSDKTRR